METFYIDRDYQAAINELVRLVRDQPNNEQILHFLGYALSAIGRGDLAHKVASQALELSPLSQQALNAEITIVLLIDDIEKSQPALETYAAAGGTNSYYFAQLALAERDVAGHEAISLYLGIIPYLKNDFDTARKALEPLKEVDGYQAFLVKWYVALIERDLDLAFGHYRAAIRAAEPSAIQRNRVDRLPYSLSRILRGSATCADA